MPLTGKETIRIGTTTGNAVAVIGAGQGYDLQDATTEVVTFVPHDAIGPQVYGPLRFRIVGRTAASLTYLGTAVRLPNLQGVPCAPGRLRCTLKGNRLLLLQAIAANDRYEGRRRSRTAPPHRPLISPCRNSGLIPEAAGYDQRNGHRGHSTG
jgi:hypothetical protein